MSEDTPVTRKELREFGEELRAGFDTLAEVMRPVAEAAAVPHAGLVQQMTMSAPPPQRAERLVVAMAVIVTVMASSPVAPSSPPSCRANASPTCALICTPSAQAARPSTTGTRRR